MGTAKNFDYEIIDTYVKPDADYFLVSAEIFQFLQDQYGVDVRIKRSKEKGSSLIKYSMGTYIRIIRNEDISE